ncbi:hypothetical protein GF373_00935 [bacterium]|nr:hypothetical protein [bacterium]
MISQAEDKRQQKSNIQQTNHTPPPFNNLTQMEKMASIGQLSASVAHEMRNLLGMIRMAAYNIEHIVQDTDQTVCHNVEVINRNVNRARDFIDNLLSLSRTPHFGGAEDLVEIAQVVDDLLVLFHKELEWRDITLTRLYQELPPVHINSHTLRESLLNLVINAIQSMEAGGELTVFIEAWEQGIRIAVRDSGCGIASGDLEKIFDHFYTTKRNGQGTGLGLSIAQSLVRDLGGTIDVRSELGIGSTFFIHLPSLYSRG